MARRDNWDRRGATMAPISCRGTPPRHLALLLTAVAAGLGSPAICQAAQTTSDVTIAAIAAGRLYVVGTTERPHTSVSLDSRFTTVSDDAGKFQYELIYHPARCIVAAEIEGKTYEAVVSNCGQQGPAGPSGGAARAPAKAGIAPAAAGSIGSDAVAAPVQTGTLRAPVVGSARPLARLPAPLAAVHSQRAPALTQVPVHRTTMRLAPSQARRPAVRPKVEAQEPDGGEVPPED